MEEADEPRLTALARAWRADSRVVRREHAGETTWHVAISDGRFERSRLIGRSYKDAEAAIRARKVRP